MCSFPPATPEAEDEDEKDDETWDAVEEAE
jgi:hypothetical protein